MTTIASPQTKIDAYLAELRKRLYSLPKDQVTDIVEEIRSHLRDTLAAGEITDARVTAALDQLGPVHSLAAGYVTDSLLARAESSRMPWTVLRGIFHWALLSVKGIAVFFVCLAGYLFGASFYIAALAKPFNQKIGLWLIDTNTFSLVLGMTDAIPRGHELLGWTIVPIGFALGGGTILVTTHFALWSIRRFRQSRAARELAA